MTKMSTTICKLLVLLLVLSLSLCSCAEIGNILEQFIGSDITGNPDDNNELNPPAGDGELNPPADDGELNPPAGDGELNPPADDGELNPPAGDGELNPPAGDGELNPPADDGELNPPADDGELNPPAGDGELNPPAGDGELNPPAGDGELNPPADDGELNPPADDGSFDYSKVPEYSGENYYVVNNNNPYFAKDEITNKSFESYSELDSLGRVGVVFASLAKDMLPTGDKGSIGHIKPTGWVQKTYPSNIVAQSQIYNRSHMIAWSIGGNDAKENLMTGTPYFNQIGMQIFESQVLDYIRETGNHVMYRVTPVFVGDNLLANGALMEAWSVEDNGDGICFCVFVYNVQPGVIIDYATGESSLPESDDTSDKSTATLVTNISDIKAGDKIIIVSADKSFALGAQSSSGNNRVAVAVTSEGNTILFGEDVQIITLGQGLSSGTFSLGIDGGFLYSASSSKNYFKTESTLSANGSWKIEISSSGVATIKSTGSYTRNWLRFNSQNAIFSSYSSGQKDVYIYKVNE